MARTADGDGHGTDEKKLVRVMRGIAQTVPMAQIRRVRKNGWTTRRRNKFLDVLKATCNVREAARAVRMNKSGAYELRRRDASFAAQWREALEEGYAELEMALLRQSIYGSETTETIDDGKDGGEIKTKKVHSYPHTIALRLLLSHRAAVDQYRNEQGIERPGSESMRVEIQRRIETVRARIYAAPDVRDGDNAGDIDGAEPERDEDA